VVKSVFVALAAGGLLSGLALGSCAPLHSPAAKPTAPPAAPPALQVPTGLIASEYAETPRKPPLPPVARPPARMQIPSVGIDARSESLAFLDVPRDPMDVGWFNNLSAPGEGGDAVFDGHLDWTTGPAVFWNLAKVKVGDLILVSGSQSDQPFKYRIDSIQSVNYLSVPPDWLYSTAGQPQLTLITCDGAWNPVAHVYEERMLVHSVLDES